MDPIRDPEGIEIDYLKQTGVVFDRDVVEIGCGNGRLTWRYADLAASIVGIDPDYAAVGEAPARRPENLTIAASFLQGEAEKLPFAHDAFQCAILAWSL